MPLSERDAAHLARMVGDAADEWDLDDAQHELMRTTVVANAHDLEGSDGMYWIGPRYAWHYLHDLAERIACGEEPRSFLDYEEARADAAC